MATKTGKKYIICDALPGDQGKTSTLVGVYNRLLSDHRFQLTVPNPSRLKRDRWGIFVEKKTGLKILIQTQGDKDFSYNRTKEYLKEKNNGMQGMKKVGQPKMKRRGDVNSITVQNTSSLNDGKNVIDWKKGLIKTPGFNKLGWCKCALHKRFKGRVKWTTISKDSDGKYYISLTIEESGSYPEPNKPITDENTIGIDFGLKTFATITDASADEKGRKINPSVFKKICDLEEKINKLLAEEITDKEMAQWMSEHELQLGVLQNEYLSFKSSLHEKILKGAGLKHIRLHDMRHTAATLMLQNGVDIKTVSGMLGHYDAGFTLRTYTHTTNRQQAEAADMMGSLVAQSL